MIEETRKILKKPKLPITATCVRVPVLNCHCESINVELEYDFKIDDIKKYLNNSDGIIEYSSSGKYIGWVAYEGHPVFDFMKGKEDMLIENIRKDSESDMYYKYGYIKHSDGYFIQIGILAEKAHNILDKCVE